MSDPALSPERARQQRSRALALGLALLVALVFVVTLAQLGFFDRGAS